MVLAEVPLAAAIGAHDPDPATEVRTAVEGDLAVAAGKASAGRMNWEDTESSCEEKRPCYPRKQPFPARLHVSECRRPDPRAERE